VFYAFDLLWIDGEDMRGLLLEPAAQVEWLYLDGLSTVRRRSEYSFADTNAEL